MAPKFISEITDVKVRKGHQAIFECVVPNTKGVCVKWLKDGKEIELLDRIRISKAGENNAQRHQLVIESVKTTDSGTYTCILSNEAGIELSAAVLEVLEDDEEKPKFATELRSITVEETEEILLDRIVIRNPDVKWFKDEKELKKSKTVDIQSISDGTQTLSVKTSTTDDSGQNKCQATNKVGTSATTATVIVNAAAEPMEVDEVAPKEEKSKCVQPLTTEAVQEGESITLPCSDAGEPKPSVKFFKDGKEIKDSANHKIVEEEGVRKLVIQKVASTDVGQHKCEAVNAAGNATTEASLKLKGAGAMEVDVKSEQAPEFISPLESTTVTVGETASLECRLQGQPQPIVSWFKGGKRVKPDKRHVIESLEDGTQKLTILEAVVQDVGQYVCKATSAAGKAVTESPLIVNAAEQIEKEVPEIEEEAPEFTTSLKSCSIKLGETAVFECALSGFPQPEVKWFKDGEEVKPDATHKIEQLPDGRQKLTVVRATYKDVGEYVCEASGSAGAVTTAADLKVRVARPRAGSMKKETAPQFSSDLEPCTVEEGETAVLECVVSGKPMPEVKWMKGGQQVQPDSRHKIESLASGQQKLVIVKATDQDVGEYTCEAVNTAGRAATFAQVDVKFAEKVVVEEEETALEFTKELAQEFTKELPKCSVKVGETATLECAIVGQPTPEVVWMKDGKEIKPDARHKIESTTDGKQKLVIEKATTDDIGQYRVEAVNPGGTATTEVQLDVKGAKVNAMHRHFKQLYKKFGRRRSKIVCRLCSKDIYCVFGDVVQATAPVDHVTGHHFGKILFTCRYCPKGYKAISVIAAHVRNYHSKSSVGGYIDRRKEYEQQIMALLTECFGAEKEKKRTQVTKREKRTDQNSDDGGLKKIPTARKSISWKKTETANRDRINDGEKNVDTIPKTKGTYKCRYYCDNCDFSTKFKKLVKNHCALFHR